jgi:beta propeller repeat protein
MKYEKHVRLILAMLVLLFTTFIICPLLPASGTETVITTNNNGFNHEFPKISGDQIVWQDQDQSSTYGIIYLYNLTSGVETQVTDNTTYTTNPAIFGDLIAYTDCGNNPTPFSPCNIYLYNISSGSRMPLSSGSDDQDYSAIYNNRIVWQDTSGMGLSQVYLNGTSSGNANPINATESNQFNPAIYGDLIAWNDLLSGNPEIFLHNLTSDQTTRVSRNPSRGDQSWPAIYGNRVVWQDSRNGKYEIFINGTAPGDEYSLTPNEPTINHQYPAIAGNWTVWVQQNLSNFDYDVLVNDTGTNQKIPVVLNRQIQFPAQPSISFSPESTTYRIVWGELNSANYYIVHLYTSGSAVTCPVASFTNDFTGGAAPVTINFKDASSQDPSITHWFWDFGDGSNSTSMNPSHPYTANGVYTVSLTVSNPYCRNTTTLTNSVIIGAPVAGFTASPVSGVVNTMISFTDNSLGKPTQWNWSWGDGTWTNGTTWNPTHSYTKPGLYTVSLTASNVYGSDTITKMNYITILAGANAFSYTTIPGITIQSSGGSQFLVFNYTTLPYWTFNPNSSVIDFTPPSNLGFQNISIYTIDPGGFTVYPGNTTIAGTIGSVHLLTQNIVPTGFSVSTGGPLCSVNYSIDLPTYPVNAVLNTQIWEGAMASDATNFNYIAIGSHFSGTNGTGYTIKVFKTNFPAGGSARLHISLNASLVNSKPDGSNELFIERIDDSGQYGQVLGTRFLYYNSTENLDYFEVDSPNGLSTFGVSFLEGAGNLFQLISLTVSSFVQNSNSGGSSQSSGSGSVSYTTFAPTVTFTPVAPQPTASPSPANNVRTTGQDTNPGNEPPSVGSAPGTPAPSALNIFLGIVSRHVYLFAAAVIAVISLLYIRQRRRRFDPLG